ncbi:hypothetical protein G3576_30750 [Roseomonas stagni]|uniref:Uncharacterized protein n=1 Tax=Falsiroseomonas algicola TaxID=2716930 RepID=A0A6M1LW57_9PROT|nr:hypothetical protein [Falsiroseomonas algicola]NGM24397.1 hypothetical protein [Falsiroseomonas algicola]
MDPDSAQHERDLVLLSLYDGETAARITRPTGLPDRREAAWELVDATRDYPEVQAAAERVLVATDYTLEDALDDVLRIMTEVFVQDRHGWDGGKRLANALRDAGYDPLCPAAVGKAGCDEPMSSEDVTVLAYDAERALVIRSERLVTADDSVLVDQRALMAACVGLSIVERSVVDEAWERAGAVL